MKKIRVRVKPNARASELTPPAEGDLWEAKLKAPPVDGKANQELVGLVARYFDCTRAQVEIVAGETGRVKLIRISA